MWPSGEANNDSNKAEDFRNTESTRKKWSFVRPSGEATKRQMTKKEKERQAKRSMKHNVQRAIIGLEELKGYYFAHGDHGSGSKFNKTVEKIAKYCRVEVSKEIYKLILYEEEAEFPEVEEPSGSRPGATALKKYEMDYKITRDG